ncbi:MAG: signal peptidase I [Ruminococcaceae bacterium]|nr:signal peptidase I [Oscillospiraceae bacterium]
MTDKRKIQLSSALVFAALLIALIVPLGESGRIVAAVLLLPAAVLLPLFFKKRSILSINKNQVLLVVAVIALLYVMLHYLTGLEFGFYKNPYRLNVSNFFQFFLPIAAVIAFSEVVRYVLLAQNDRLTSALCYLSCVIADMLICSNIPAVTSFARLMDLVAGALFPALVSNLLYTYLSKRYGLYPNLAFRAITTLYAYTLPIVPGISESLTNLFKLFLPIVVYLFIDSLYEKKRRYALGNTSPLRRILSKILTAVVVIIMIGTMMLISNQFYFGAYVIATDSMTGELNRGDVAIYESYEDQLIKEGQVIVFEKNNTIVVHRVADIKIINEKTRYYTKGDVNEDIDAGFITDGDIIGLVNVKLPYFGYPTLWIRSLFKR